MIPQPTLGGWKTDKEEVDDQMDDLIQKAAHGEGGHRLDDQFAANKQLFGVETKFDESVYTTQIDKSKIGISEEEAARIAREIEGKVSSNPHVAEERNQKLISDFDDDEEAKYSSCLLYTSPSPRDMRRSRMPSSA